MRGARATSLHKWGIMGAVGIVGAVGVVGYKLAPGEG